MTLKSFVAFAVWTVGAIAQEAVYKNDFQSAEIGKVPQDMMVIDGAFAVAAQGSEKFLELPGAPLDTFGVLFGPTEKENRTASARIFGTSKGRRAPTFSIGLGGVGGYKLQVSPGKKLLELYKSDAVKTSVPFDWQSGKWTHLEVTLKKAKEAEWKIEGRAWTEDSQEPAAPTITFTETEQPVAGRAYVGGSPYATTPIRFDDLYTGPAK
jgi:hypothetical protein